MNATTLCEDCRPFLVVRSISWLGYCRQRWGEQSSGMNNAHPPRQSQHTKKRQTAEIPLETFCFVLRVMHLFQICCTYLGVVYRSRPLAAVVPSCILVKEVSQPSLIVYRALFIMMHRFIVCLLPLCRVSCASMCISARVLAGMPGARRTSRRSSRGWKG